MCVKPQTNSLSPKSYGVDVVEKDFDEVARVESLLWVRGHYHQTWVFIATTSTRLKFVKMCASPSYDKMLTIVLCLLMCLCVCLIVYVCVLERGVAGHFNALPCGIRSRSKFILAGNGKRLSHCLVKKAPYYTSMSNTLYWTWTEKIKDKLVLRAVSMQLLASLAWWCDTEKFLLLKFWIFAWLWRRDKMSRQKTT